MYFEPKLDKFNPETFFEDYFKSCGVENLDEYFNASEKYLDDWRKYPQIYDGIELLQHTIQNQKRVGIVIDSDMDGLCSGGIAYLFLKDHNIQPITYFHRGKLHGITKSPRENLVKQIIADKIDLLWMPDAGSNDVVACKELFDAGIKVLITDHHEILEENPYAVVINNKANKQLNQCLSGAGVTWKLLCGYCETYKEPLDTNYVGMVACSLISDVMDMRSLENRAIWNIAFGADGRKVD